jgi:excisionase family DNA binding protein
MSEVLLTPGDVARRCQVSTKTVLRAIQAGRLRASRLGQRGAYRVREIDVDVWIEGAIVEPAGRALTTVTELQQLPKPGPPTGRLAVRDGMGRRSG